MPPRKKSARRSDGPVVRVSREFTFDAAHRLEHYKGKCEALHGHTYRLRVTLEAPVGPDGIAFDFYEMKRLAGERVLDALDHTYLNDILRQPTAENVAMWIWKRLEGLPLFEIRVWETPTSFVTVRGAGKSQGK
jgi:6-pyruvoyltetrahydropterin/6-carboxytetrahydropterin synthase